MEDTGDDLYLIPQHKAEACLSKDTMIQIAEKASDKARQLAFQTRREIEKQLDNAIYYQMKKLEHKAHFMRSFWGSFNLEKCDMQLAKEELLAERVALTMLRSGEIKGTNTERVLSGNEFSTLTSTLKEI